MERTTAQRKVQIVWVGEGQDRLKEMLSHGGIEERETIILEPESIDSTDWQTRRASGEVWAVVAIPPDDPDRFALLKQWVQAISLSLRPSRLLVLASDLRLRQTLELLRLGADGILPHDAPVKTINEELETEGIASNEFFPDPSTWLDSLRRSAEELFLSHDPHVQINKLLRIYKSYLGVDRASVVLNSEYGFILAGAIGMPPSLKIGDPINVDPGSITGWVLENRRPRLIEGEFTDREKNKAKPVRSAICAPLITQNDVLGAVSFSSLTGGRRFTQTDLATIEIFATLLAFAISNHRLFEQNLEAERLAIVGRTTASVSHCIKNILQLFHGSLFLIDQGIERREMETIENGASLSTRAMKRLEELILDLLDFSREREPDLEKCSPTTILEEIQEIYTTPGVAENHDVEVECEFRERVMLDANRLSRALANLVSNSIDATPSGGTVLLRAFQDGKSIVFAVSDNGPGVPEEKLANIFNPFFSTKGSKGTGLGLAMVSKFAEENQGEVLAKPCERLGGLCVQIRLPIRT